MTIIYRLHGASKQHFGRCYPIYPRLLLIESKKFFFSLFYTGSGRRGSMGGRGGALIRAKARAPNRLSPTVFRGLACRPFFFFSPPPPFFLRYTFSTVSFIRSTGLLNWIWGITSRTGIAGSIRLRGVKCPVKTRKG